MSKKENPIASGIDWPWSKETIKGKLMPTTATRKISDFVDPGDTPGNVGLCFSGGGSVAMISALGQLRALHEMGVLGKARAISTVSGGSWALVPFTYLPDDISDETFLGQYVDNPKDLTLDNSDEPTSLNYVEPGYMGYAVAQDGIKWNAMALEALKLVANPLVPADRIWAYLIAEHILKPFGLSDANPLTGIQNGWFAHTEADAKAIKAENPGLPETVHTYQQGEGRINRPYHLCNTSMFIDHMRDPATKDTNMLASVQCTAKGTGIFATGLGVPYESEGSGRQQVGGGLVSSHAFNGQLNKVDGNDVEVKMRKNAAFSLADITANSSAFFATAIQDLGKYMDPEYNYWPVADATPDNPGSVTKFADGGAIEDNGLLNMLAYDDIDKVVVFTNALTPIWKDDQNPDTKMNLVVDPWWATYFGYTPYQKLNKKGKTASGLPVGYHKYEDLAKDPDFSFDGKGLRYYRPNQIFDSDLFPEFLATLEANSNNYTGPSYYHNAAMKVNYNAYFGVNSRTVELLLVHYGPYKPFTEALQKDVKLKMEVGVKINQAIHRATSPATPADGLFPNLILLQTHMEPFLANLFAHFTAHVAMTQADTIKAMFE